MRLYPFPGEIVPFASRLLLLTGTKVESGDVSKQKVKPVLTLGDSGDLLPPSGPSSPHTLC